MIEDRRVIVQVVFLSLMVLFYLNLTSTTVYDIVKEGVFSSYLTMEVGEVQKDRLSDTISTSALYIGSRDTVYSDIVSNELGDGFGSETFYEVDYVLTDQGDTTFSLSDSIRLGLESKIYTILLNNNKGLGEEIVTEIISVFFFLCQYYGFDPVVMYAWIKQESSWRVRVTSSKGAVGLAQIMPTTGEEVSGWVGMSWDGVDTLKDPIKNLCLGFAYFSWLRDIFPSDHQAFSAYFWGIGNVRNRNMIVSTYSSNVLGTAETVSLSLTVLDRGERVY